LLASDIEIKHLANKATALYISSLVKVARLTIAEEKLVKFAESMGLAQLPEEAQNLKVEEVVDRKRKMSPLERLKEKIRQKKQAKKQETTQENGWEEMKDDLTDMLNAKKKKVSKFERRQRRLDELRSSDPIVNDDASGDDEPLFAPKEETTVLPKYTPAELKALQALRKQKLRIKSDGTFNVRGAGGLGAQGDKIVFSDNEE
jgi:ATP-dependent RNA helicase DDX10/DBP4